MRTAAMWALLSLAAVPTRVRAQIDAVGDRIAAVWVNRTARSESEATVRAALMALARGMTPLLRAEQIALFDTYPYGQLLTARPSR